MKAEKFKPISVKPPGKNFVLFWMRCILDLQLLTIYRFLRGPLQACKGSVLDVGAGEAPWQDLLNKDPGVVKYNAIDVETADTFGMSRQINVTYYDGKTIPFAENSYDYVLCIEVLEHVEDPKAILNEIYRVLKPGGSLILTMPWSARLHHMPHDYCRFTRFGLAALVKSVGLTQVTIEERGNNIAAIANKLIVLTLGWLRPRTWYHVFWTGLLAIVMLPVTGLFLVSAHLNMLINSGINEDPLGYGLIAIKPKLS